jgi:pyrroloquinoline quinone (PQQ) biosynthesis protein C
MKTKAQYKVKNWNAYDAALKQRGSITFACERRSHRAVAQPTENREKGSIELLLRYGDAFGNPKREHHNGNDSVGVSSTRAASRGVFRVVIHAHGN